MLTNVSNFGEHYSIIANGVSKQIDSTMMAIRCYMFVGFIYEEPGIQPEYISISIVYLIVETSWSVYDLGFTRGLWFYDPKTIFINDFRLNYYYILIC